MDLYSRQLTLEGEMSHQGAKRFWEGIQKAREGGQESKTVYGMHLAKAAVKPLKEAIAAYLEVQAGVQRGPRPVAVRFLSRLAPEVAAYITVKIVLDGLTLQRTVQKTAIMIGSGIEDEVRFARFATVSKPLWTVLNKDIAARTHLQSRKRGTLIHCMKKASGTQADLLWDDWGQIDKFHLGYRCLDLLVQTSSLVKIVTIQHGPKKSTTMVHATDETMKWVEGKTGRSELLSPVFLPTIIPPKPWTSPYGGGYYSPGIRPLKLVKTYQKNYLEELSHRTDEMPIVYESVNAVQATPWRINTAVLTVMQATWDSEIGIGDLPPRQDIPLPPKPPDITTNKESRTLWKRAASKVYAQNAKLGSRRLQMVKLLHLAEKFQPERAIYFPHQLDFRGRLYAIPSYLNPQGNDMAKALLEFSEGKPLGDAGMRWLLIHAANSWGMDKISLAAREAWTRGCLQDILSCAEHPLEERWWTGAEKPWQFLAVCCELRAAILQPDYVSHLPVSVDGTCNGLQNFSAMLRDPVGGAATNLLPSEQPNDIYQQVAEVAKARIRLEALAGEPLAISWEVFGFDRKATKRPVMVLPYGGTLFSARQYLLDYITTRVEGGEQTPWGDDHFPASLYLAKHVWASIGEVVIAARAAMGWLQTVATLAASEGLPVNWTTPVGFPVLQAYADMRPRTVSTMLGDRVVQHLLQEETDKLDTRRQSSGISPNMVHSMDAACLMLSVHKCRAAGLGHFAMVHDSYGVHAADMEILGVCLREAFVELYQRDVLEEFRGSIAAGLSEKNLQLLPAVPEKGTLDLAMVKQSVYFFA